MINSSLTTSMSQSITSKKALLNEHVLILTLVAVEVARDVDALASHHHDFVS